MSYPESPQSPRGHYHAGQPPYGQQPPGPPYGQPVSPPPYYPPQVVHAPAPDKSKKFLNMSGGMLMVVGAVVLVVCCLGPLGFCLFGGALGSIGDATKPKADVTLTGCQIDDASEYLRSAKITYTIRNTGKSEGDYLIKFVVTNAAGSQVGDGSAWAFNLAGGASKTATETVYLDAAGGKTCRVSSVE